MNPPHLSRRRCLQTALLGAALFAGTSTPAATLPTTASLPQELALAMKAGRPLLVMVSLEGCTFCKQVRDSHLAPMREREGLAVVQLDMRNKQAVVDFDGRSLTQDELIRRWGVSCRAYRAVLWPGRR
jgi:thioredoxin-related protein